MTREEMVKIFKDHDEDFGEFQAIATPLSTRPDVNAFMLLDRLIPGRFNDLLTAADHDEIYLDVDPDAFAAVATEENIIDLIRCGIRYDDEEGEFRMFV